MYFLDIFIGKNAARSFELTWTLPCSPRYDRLVHPVDGVYTGKWLKRTWIIKIIFFIFVRVNLLKETYFMIHHTPHFAFCEQQKNLLLRSSTICFCSWLKIISLNTCCSPSKDSWNSLLNHSLWRQRLNIPYFSGGSHGKSINHIEVLFPKEKKPFASVKALNSSTAVHMLNLKWKTRSEQKQVSKLRLRPLLYQNKT